MCLHVSSVSADRGPDADAGCGGLWGTLAVMLCEANNKERYGNVST